MNEKKIIYVKPPVPPNPKSMMIIIMKRGFRSEPCTIQCVRAMGTIPQLQCKKCLCLYHHECVGLGATSTIESYVCQVGDFFFFK